MYEMNIYGYITVGYALALLTWAGFTLVRCMIKKIKGGYKCNGDYKGDC